MTPTESVLDAYWQTPPMARTFATIVFVLSVSVYTLGVPWTWFFFYDRMLVWKMPPEIWRFVTTFLVSGPKFGILLDPYFVYRYMSELEKGHPRFPRREDVLWYLMFVCGSIMGFNYFVDLTFSPVLPPISALIMAMCYSVTQDQRGMKATLYFITIPAQLLPYAMILISVLMGAPIEHVYLQLEGLVAAHLYDFLSRLWPEFGGGRNWIATPAFVSRLIQTPREVRRDYGTAVHGRSTGQSTGANTGPLPDSWRTRGAGHRLG